MQTLLDALRRLGLSHAAVALLTAVLAAGVTLSIDDNGPGQRHVTISVGPNRTPTETKVDASSAPGRQDSTVKVPIGAAVQVAQSPELSQPGGLRTENPAGVTPEQLDASRDKQEQLAQTDQLPIVQPDAAPQQAGCVSRFVRNYSTRRGVRPREIVLHYTVSPNRPGWTDVNAIVNLFNSPSSQASSNYVVDAEGNCAYIVRESDKSWTQAAGNPFSISFEIIATGHEPTFCTGPCQAKVAKVIAAISKRWEIPLQPGLVAGCIPVRPGIIQHKDWGLCGGGHFDISPFQVAPFIVAAQVARCSERCQVRREHARTHKAIRDHRCAPEARSRSINCKTFYARNHAMHARARQLGVTL